MTSSSRDTSDVVSADRTGLIESERALLLAVVDKGKRSSAQVLTKLAGGVPSFPPKATYSALAALTRRTCVPYPLIVGEGNFGAGSEEPADPEFTNCRPSKVGAIAVSAARRSGPPVPLDLVNGSLHRNGKRPGFDAQAIAAALLTLVKSADLSQADLSAIVGEPIFAGRAVGVGDTENLLLGNRVEYRFDGQVEQRDGELYIVGLPLGVSTAELITEIGVHLERLAMDHSHPDRTAIWIARRNGEDLEALADSLTTLPTMSSTVELALPGPLDQILRGWIAAHGTEDVVAGAQSLSSTS